jgi:hypothetical protein
MENFDNIKTILQGFNDVVRHHSDELADAAAAGDPEAVESAVEAIAEMHRQKEIYSRYVLARVANAKRNPSPSS